MLNNQDQSDGLQVVGDIRIKLGILLFKNYNFE